jgi:phosphoenolpyruvate-protein phosphotransferase
MSASKQETLTISSPLSGWCATLDDSPDPVFREKILGNGVSIDPTVGEVRAPFNGEVLTVPDSRHAINLRALNGAEFLIHVGIDSVKLAGDGFVAYVAPGARVKAGQLLLSFDLDKVLRGASSLKTPVLLLQSDGFEVCNLHTEGSVEIGDPLFEIRSLSVEPQSSHPDSQDDSEELTKVVVVGLQHGIHARPAAALVTAIKTLEANVFCQLGEKPKAKLSSAVALMSLGVSYGDQVTLIARGQQAQQAIDAVETLLEPLLDPRPVDPNREQTSTSTATESSSSDSIPEAPAAGTLIRAQAASAGLGMGKAFKLDVNEDLVTTNSGSVVVERQTLKDAVTKVRTHLKTLADADQSTGSEIAIAHLALLDDPLIGTAADTLLTGGHSAASAWRGSVNEAVETLSQLDDPRMLERVDDLFDINLRVQRVLAGQKPGKGSEIPAGSIVIADNMLPSQLLELDHQRINGICLAAGGATSHVAILALSRNIPMLVAAGASVLSIEDNSELLIDAELGELHVRPDKTASAAFHTKLEQYHIRHQQALACALDECHTSDGIRIHINANLASAKDAIAAVKAGAEGCGLLRTEFAFMDKTMAPGIDEQLQTYRPIAKALGPGPLVIRTLDAGGDKPISYIDQKPEENPALGVRGIRLSLQHTDLLHTQLEALLEIDKSAPLHMMIPMVSSVHEVQAVRDLLDELISSDTDRAEVKLGVMIETPAAALIADRLAEIVDFFSIGTNDLTQYTLCMDREEPQFAADLDALHPAVLKLIKCTVDAANKANIPVAVCGGAAGDMLAAPVLLGLGIHELSMPYSLIARQKAHLRTLSMNHCVQMANTALGMNSAEDVRNMMRTHNG